MKKIYAILVSILLVGLLSACQEDEQSQSNVGYLRLGLQVNTAATTRVEEVYNPKQLAVQIINDKGTVVKETTNFENEWAGEPLALPVGVYTVKASSAGFDGATSAFDKPYYAGSTEVTIELGKSANAEITCTLANVKVTVNFDQSFVDAFTAANVEVDDNANPNNAGISPLTFVMGTPTQSGYFPVTDLKAVVSATNKQGVTNTQPHEITGVQARDHYILNYKVAAAEPGEETGEGNVSIEVDPTTRKYTYNIGVSFNFNEPVVAVANTNPWAKLAYVEGTIGANGVDISGMEKKFLYRVKETQDWTDVTAALEGETCKATLTNLTPETTYECQLVCGTYASDITEFTTEAATALYNGSFDDWTYGGSGYTNTWFAGASGSTFNNSFWDSGNIGTSTGMAAMLGAKNPTSPEETIVHTPGSKSAKLASIYVVIQFAAGNIYTGNYQETIMSPMGARINFGQPFTARPIALHGWIQYTPGQVNRGDDGNLPENATLKLGDTDQNALYIALSDKGSPYEVNNGAKQFIDFDNDPNIIAYGALPQEECVKTPDGEWKEVNIPLVYRSLDRKPTHIIIVMSASKYGDYFVGSDSSVMYIDDFSLVYDGEPSVLQASQPQE